MAAIVGLTAAVEWDNCEDALNCEEIEYPDSPMEGGCMNWDAYFYMSDSDVCNTMWK